MSAARHPHSPNEALTPDAPTAIDNPPFFIETTRR